MGPQTCCQHASWRQPSCVTPHPSSFLLLIVFGLHPSSDGLQPKCCKNCLVFTVWFSVSKRRLSLVKAWRASATMPSGTTCHKRFHVRFRFQFWSGHLLLFFLPFCFLLGTRMLLGAKGIVLSLSQFLQFRASRSRRRCTSGAKRPELVTAVMHQYVSMTAISALNTGCNRYPYCRQYLVLSWLRVMVLNLAFNQVPCELLKRVASAPTFTVPLTEKLECVINTPCGENLKQCEKTNQCYGTSQNLCVAPKPQKSFDVDNTSAHSLIVCQSQENSSNKNAWTARGGFLATRSRP